MSDKITADHLSKNAIVYIRQSSQHQVRHHVESQHLQYDLVKRAERLGWSKSKIVVLDDDLGVSGTGVEKRHGFEKLLQHLCTGEVGAILVLNSPRMARNVRDWHQVLEVSRVFKTLIIDSDGVYDPRVPSDQLWIGMKASFSEYEVNQLQALARAAIVNKAQRGQLFHNLPAGFVATEDNAVELDPDQRIQQAIRTIFAKFDELGSIRQVYKWHHRERLEIPVREYKDGVGLTWRLPTYSTLNKILINPLYAGIYMYPKTKTRTRIVDGRTVKTSGHRSTPEDNPILIPNLFEGYISAEQFEHNQKIIANNTHMRGKMTQGAAREGTSLLAGLLRCGRCSRKLMVHYSAGQATPSYFCPRGRKVANAKNCLRFNGRVLEQFISEQLIMAVEPMAIEAAFAAEEKLSQATRQKAQALFYALEQAKYQARRIERQFNATDPENYLVSRTLASRWQRALQKVEEVQRHYHQAAAEQQPLSEAQRVRLFELAADLKSAWEHPGADGQIKTRLVRLLIKEVWVKEIDHAKIKATIHWQGGVHTAFEFKRGRALQRGDAIKEQDKPVELIGKLARVCNDQQITRIFNRARIKNPKHPSWSEFEITELREENNIPAFSQKNYDTRGLVNLKQAADILNISLSSVLQLIRCGLIEAEQVIKYAPWEIKRTELDKSKVQRAVASIKKGKPIPFHQNQQNLNI